MGFYDNELRALQKSGILRRREVYCESCDNTCIDFASNDYLGLSNRKDSSKKAYKLATNPKFSAPRASMLVNGYSKLHQKLEHRLAQLNDFESCILVGSGFLANIALIESLVRKGDRIFIDSEYHASGLLASKLVQGVEFFRHNDYTDLEAKILSSLRDSAVAESWQSKICALAPESRPLRGAKNWEKGCSSATADFLLEADKRGTPPKSEKAAAFWRVGGVRRGVQPFLQKEKSDSRGQNDESIAKLTHPLAPSAREGETKDSRILIAIEGIYSMSGDIAPKEFAQIAQKYNAILIVDEAHSSGTLGQNLLGYFDFHHIKITPNFIKLGTFSKAYGSYGAYILSSAHIHSYLQTRAKPIIYSTALSAFDTALALVNLNFIHQNRTKFRNKIQKIQKVIQKKLKIKLDSQIFSIQFQSQNEMLKTFCFLKKCGVLVGAIRKPSVKIPQLRIILSTKHKKKDIIALCKLLKK